jgi:hypothetical protein
MATTPSRTRERREMLERSAFVGRGIDDDGRNAEAG